MPIFRVKWVKIYTGQKNLHWQLSGMLGSVVTTTSPGWWSTMKATRRSVAPTEIMRDESSLMIIENEVEAKRRKKEQEGLKRWWKLSNCYCNHLKSSWGRPSRPEKEGRACRGERDVLGTLRIELFRKSWCTSCWLWWRRWWWRQW